MSSPLKTSGRFLPKNRSTSLHWKLLRPWRRNLWIEFCQTLGMIKEQIGGVLGPGCAPVVTLLEGGNNLTRLD